VTQPIDRPINGMMLLFTELWYLWVLVIFAGLFSLFKPKIKGIIGEKTIAALLSRLDNTKYKVINDVMLNINGKTTQIDHIVVSNFGIFVIETKNYKGWIIGDDFNEYWTQVIYKRQEKLYNPIRQNYAHVQALKEHLKDFGEFLYVPIVVFSVNTTLKVRTKAHVIYTPQLIKTIKGYSEAIISDHVKNRICSKIQNINITDKEVKKGHIMRIRDNIEAKKVINTTDTCPKCGGSLIQRSGKFGSFKGCSNFPKCRFSIN